MNFKTTYVLFGGLGLLVVGLVVVFWINKGSDGDEENQSLFPSLFSKDKEKARTRSLAADDVTKVTIQRKKPTGDDVVFVRDGKDWRISSPRALRAEGQRVTGLIDAILNARSDDKSKPASMKAGGLDSPSRVISIEGKDRVLTLTIGDQDPGTQGVAYVTSSDRPKQPLAVLKQEIESALEDLGYFRAKDLLGDNTQDATSVKISDTKKGTVELTKDKGRWRFKQPTYGDASLDGGLLNALGGLRVEYKSEKDNDFVRDNVADLSEIKDLDKSNELRIEVGHDGKKTAVVILTGKKVGEKYYAYLDEPGKPRDVVKVSVASVEPFVKVLEDPSSLRSKNLLALAPGQTPDAIDVQNNDRTDGLLQFRKPEKAFTWTLYRNGLAVPTDGREVSTLVNTLSGPTAVVSYVDPKRRKELGLDNPKLVVKIYSDALVSDEKKDDKKEKDAKKDAKKDDKTPTMPALKKDAKPVTELRFGKAEGPNVAVERVWGDDTSIVMVADVVLQQLQKKPLAYYDRGITPFSPGASPDDDVTKVEVISGKDVTEVTRDKPTSPWVIAKPAAQKGRNASEPAVRAILDAVNHLRVVEIEAEKATAAELEKYGLKSPTQRVVVTQTKDKKETKHEFEFGKDADGKGVYARIVGKDVVYLVGKEATASLGRELRDPSVFGFDADKVVTVKLTGWYKRDKEIVTRTLERKEGKWVIKEKPTQNVDDAKVRDSLSALASLKAEKFLAAGKGFDLVKDDALKIEVTLDDKKTYDLTLGAEEGASYYAISGQLKGEAVLVPKALFEEVRSSPVSFVK